MLVPLFLWQSGLIRSPRFFMFSASLEARRETYYDALLAVSRDDDWTGWCRAFFLEAIRTQAEDDLAKAQAILTLYEDMKRRVSDLTGSRYAIHALDCDFSKPRLHQHRLSGWRWHSSKHDCAQGAYAASPSRSRENHPQGKRETTGAIRVCRLTEHCRRPGGLLSNTRVALHTLCIHLPPFLLV